LVIKLLRQQGFSMRSKAARSEIIPTHRIEVGPERQKLKNNMSAK